MILGVGTDLMAVARLEREITRHGSDFLTGFLGPSEIAAGCRKHAGVRFYAACFAAKEAFLKALGTGLTGGISWLDVEVVMDDQGRPGVVLTGEASRAADAAGARRAHISLTGSNRIVMATVLLES